MSQLTVVDWANQPDPVVFGHCKPSNLASYEQVQLIFKEIGTTAEGYVNAYVVADDVERRMLSAELGHRQSLIADAVMPNVCDYAALLRQLRSPGVSRLWEQVCVTIVAQIDQHYSAPFALSILEIVKWAANPTSKTRLRVLTVSALKEPEESIQRALEYFCPKLTVSLVESPSQIQIARAAPRRLLWTDPESVEEAVKLIEDQAKKQRTSIVLCHIDTACEITEGLLGRARDLFNSDRFVDTLLRLRIEPVDPEFPPAVIFCTEISQIPMEIYNLGAIVISRYRRADLWEYGRIVRKPVQTSQWEVDRAVSYLWQTSSPTMGITILAPETAGLCKLPHRRVDNDQAIPFLVDVFANFDGMNMDDMISCFVTDFAIVQSNLSQLTLMNCARKRAGRFVLQPGAGQKLLLEFLPLFQYQFLPAWFLATGVTLSGATVSARKAMIRLAAIVHEGVDFINRRSIFWQEVKETEKVERLQTLASEIMMQFKMPLELIQQGGLWVALAAWHSASITMDGFRASTNTEILRNVTRDVVNDTGIVFIEIQLAKRIGDLVDKLEDFVGIRPQDKGNRPLFLDENDCKVIQNVMVQTWMHRTMCIVDLPGVDGAERTYSAADMVSMDTTLGSSGTDLMPLGAMMGSRGTGSDVMILAALSLERPLRYSCGIQFGSCVVIPVERIREWQNKNNGRNFFKSIQCDHPRVEDDV